MLNRLRLLWVGPATVIAAAVAVRLAQAAAWLLLTEPSPLARQGLAAIQVDLLRRSLEPTILTAVLVTAAVFVFAIVASEAIDPVATYRRVALVTLLLSFIPDLIAGATSLFQWSVAIVYMALHVVAWAVTVTMLTRLMAPQPPPVAVAASEG